MYIFQGARHLNDDCSWPSLRTEYRVEKLAKHLIVHAHQEIQRRKRHIDFALRQRLGIWVNIVNIEDTTRASLGNLLAQTRLTELFESETETVIQSLVEDLLGHVHQVIERIDCEVTAPPCIDAGFFTRVCEAATYETYLQNSLNDLVFDEEVSKFKSPKSPVLGLECP
jgi:hypothetical protein